MIPCAVLVLLAMMATITLAADVYVPGDDVPVDTSQQGTSPAPSVPGVPAEDDDPTGPSDPADGEDGEDRFVSPVETLPPDKDEGFPLVTPDNPVYILIAVVILGVISSYAPGEIRRLRIEAATRESMEGRLALAKGDFVTALAAFDRAIDQAHAAYTNRWRTDRPAEWKLLPDRFYIGLWRGRAAALMGVGRERSAFATMRIVRELELALNGHQSRD